MPSSALSELTGPLWEQRTRARVGDRALLRSRQVIRAARQIVADGGLEAVSLRPLLERSGLSRRAFYARFSGMDDVLLALYEDTMTTGAVQLSRRIAGIESPVARLEALVRAMASISQRPSRDRIYMLAMSSQHARLAEQRPDDLVEATRPMTGLMAEILAEGMQAGEIRRTDPEPLAQTVFALVTSEIHRSIHLGRRGTSWIDELCAFCVHGIGLA